MNDSLTCISPIDGRYKNITAPLHEYFSEYALMKYRCHVEIEYFIALLDMRGIRLSSDHITALRKLRDNFSLSDAEKIKEIEKTTNHDIKAVEYFLKSLLSDLWLDSHSEMVHFALTSQDINNTANPLMLTWALQDIIFPEIQSLIEKLHSLAQELKWIPMLARTHGQAATPTDLGKEIMVFVYRLQREFAITQEIKISWKFGGVIGGLNSHFAAYPDTNWINFADDFMETKLWLERQPFTTQISSYDDEAKICDAMKRMSTILEDFCQDTWTYISLEYFGQKTKEWEVGSSAMPHKVNPIDFENAEGNLGMAKAIFTHLANTLPKSRLQRDLTDSTVLRNMWVPFSHLLISLSSIKRGLEKLKVNEWKITQDLQNNPMVISEAIQTILRVEWYPEPYEALKWLTRWNTEITLDSIYDFVRWLEINDELKERLCNITPENYRAYYPKI